MSKQTKENDIIKLALLGDYYVGKSSIIKRYTLDEFDSDYISNHSSDYFEKIIKLENKNIELHYGI